MLCLYGIVRSSHPGVTVLGVGRQPTSVVAAGGIAAIVSAAGDELLARRRDVEAHLAVLEEALSVGDVLPFRFGVVLPDAGAVRDLLDRSTPRFRELLARVGGRVQMTLKLIRDDDESVRAVVESDVRLRRLVVTSRTTTAWAEKVALGERVAIAVERLSKRDVDEMTRRLSAVAEAIEVNRTTSTPPAVATIALLVQPARTAELDRLVACLHDEFGHRLGFEYAGPMPAYSFVS